MNTREPLMDRELQKREWTLVNERRKAAGIPAEESGTEQPKNTIGLALSGGGIRSATFCLGVLQALAKQKLLIGIDYLSTVSGGGYIGGFLGAWINKAHVREVQQHLAESVGGGAKDGAQRLRVAAEPPKVSKLGMEPIKYLRENGRYLAPNGAVDMRRNVAAQIRNFLSMHVVFGLFALSIFLVFNLAGFVAHQLGAGAPASAMIGGLLSLGGLEGKALTLLSGIQWSKTWVLIAGVLAFWTVPSIVAYWFADAEGKKLPGLLALRVAAVAAVLISGTGLVYGMLRMRASNVLGETAGAGLGWLACLLVSSCITLVAIRSVSENSPSEKEAAKMRNRIDSSMADSLAVFALACGYWVIDTIACTFANLIVNGGLRQYLWCLASVVLLPAFSALFREVYPLLSTLPIFGGRPNSGDENKDKPSWYGKAMLWAAACLAGLLYLSSIALVAKLTCSVYVLGEGTFFGSLLTNVSLFGPVTIGALVTILCIACAWALGSEFTFVNYASMQTQYAARLSRAYLGASNPARHGVREKESESGPQTDKPQPNWDVTRTKTNDVIDFLDYKPYENGGPLHLINVTVNETVSGKSALDQQDRKGFLLDAGPAGLSARSREGHCFEWPFSIGGASHAENSEKRPSYETLTLGEWLAISGAAVSTGCGFRTSKALSLLLGLFNVRLGYWWDSGLDPSDAGVSEDKSPGARLGELCSRVFKNQSALLDEFTARFHGPARRRWFLSDGGHFENTACYELLRRQTPLILCCDCGEDGSYAFVDFINLMRKARIDFGAEFEPLKAEEMRDYLPLDAIGSLDELKPDGSGLSKKNALAARVRYADGNTSIVVLIKPTLDASTPLDLLEYRSRHPDFPQQSTADQFFDEAQWESYRKLGECIGTRLFGAHLHADFLHDALDLWRMGQPGKQGSYETARIGEPVNAEQETLSPGS